MSKLFADDPRTMWAWAEHLDDRLDLKVSDKMAHQVLATIPPGEHVEVFGAVEVSKHRIHIDGNRLPIRARFAARTFSAWIVPSEGERASLVPATGTKHYLTELDSTVQWLCVSKFIMSDGQYLGAFADSRRVRLFDKGAGRSILRLPDNSQAPTPPRLGSAEMLQESDTPPVRRLLADWRTAEDIALWHMRGPLGLFGAQLTGGVSDHGIDVEHPDAVAQVKMQATPVGAPQVRQLRGAKPNHRGHIYYSTSGYTRAAVQEAAETGVALFIICDDATVRPHRARAEELILDGHRRSGGDDALVADYVEAVTGRIVEAQRNYSEVVSQRALRAAHPDGVFVRAYGYLSGASDAIEKHPRIGAVPHRVVISHFRNADLRAAFFCSALGLPYPGDKPVGEKRKRRTADDFYS